MRNRPGPGMIRSELPRAHSPEVPPGDPDMKAALPQFGDTALAVSSQEFPRRATNWIDRGTLQMDDAALDGRGGGLRPILHSQFAQYVLDVILHRVLGDVQAESDLLVSHPLHDEAQHRSEERRVGKECRSFRFLCT